MEIERIVGDNIRFIRQKRGLVQDDLAVLAKMSRGYLGEVERAERSLTINRLARIAKVLKVEVAVLVTKDGYKSFIV